jgi:hypothetical protein
MNVEAVLEAVEGLPLSRLVAESAWLFPTLETLHVIAIGLVIGTILFVDLRLLGVTWRRDDAEVLVNSLLPWTWTAFAFAVVSGALMFISSAARYFDNPAFLAKMALLALAGLNMSIFHRTGFRTVREWRLALPTPMAARAAASLSILLWMGIVACGRWIGFL